MRPTPKISIEQLQAILGILVLFWSIDRLNRQSDIQSACRGADISLKFIGCECDSEHRPLNFVVITKVHSINFATARLRDAFDLALEWPSISAPRQSLPKQRISKAYRNRLLRAGFDWTAMRNGRKQTPNLTSGLIAPDRPWQRPDISDGSKDPIVNKKWLAVGVSWSTNHFTYPQSATCLEDVYGQHVPRRWIHTSWAAGTKRARSSYTTRRKRSNKKGTACGSRTVPRSLLGFIRGRVDWWFNWTTATKNSDFLWCELSWPFCLTFFFQPPIFAGRIRNSLLGICFAMHGMLCSLGRGRDVDAMFRDQ